MDTGTIDTELRGNDLQSLLAPISLETFLQEYWQTKALYVEGEADKFEHVFSLERFHSAIHRADGQELPGYRISAIGTSRPDDPLTLASLETISPHDVNDLIDRGVTICVNKIDAADERLAALVESIKQELGYLGEVRFNCYLSPHDSGADTHLDARVATTLQIAGKKRWRYAAESAFPWPRSNAQRDSDGMPTWMFPWVGAETWEQLPPVDESAFEEVILEPGDMLCLPAGAWHNAKAIGYSLALNLAFSPVDVFALINQILYRHFVHDAAWRGGPPPVPAAMGDSTIAPPVLNYLRERFAEICTLLEGFDPDDEQWRRVWHDITGQ